MPRFYPNQLISDCWSSMGNVTFYHRNGMCYWKTKPQPVFPGTAAQLQQLDVHRRALAAWRGVSDEKKSLWRSFARSVLSHRPPYTMDHHITGHNLFVSAYHGFAVLGREHVPEPKAFVDFPVFDLTFVRVEKIEERGLRLIYDLTASEDYSVGRFAVLGKIQLNNAGGGFNSGKMKNVLASSVVMKEQGKFEVEFVIDDYRNFCGIDSTSYSVHMKYLLIDKERGYRSNAKKVSASAVYI